MDATALATLWAFIALIGFLGILLFKRVDKTAVAALDDRAARIAKELDEARRLREEAQALLAEYQRKAREAGKVAEDIVENAKAEAIRLTAESEAALSEMIERRTKSVETKIAQAETQALGEIRAIAADVAIAAASKILADKVNGPLADAIVSKSIAT
ncbi:ATP F0F1 synthase subunit B [Methylobrevis pamukkalensis]|uniref:ATP synthase subunit b n=1 Tax=Methylobrevis pamukkalensis TaxID=1439726 RepID=A0A1E3H0V3_9HYPH|nr:ATP F0F1 synthase subunit B [Methylobrevis pamukkalensis]ODN69446.1 ATP synthase subunit b precursor [Methylobrevis pamukkalensis]